jgi:hypothetical protein
MDSGDSFPGDKATRVRRWTCLTNAKIKNEWIYTSTPPSLLNGMYKEHLTFYGDFKLTNFGKSMKLNQPKVKLFKSRTDVLLFLSQYLKTGRMNYVWYIGTDVDGEGHGLIKDYPGNSLRNHENWKNFNLELNLAPLQYKLTGLFLYQPAL